MKKFKAVAVDMDGTFLNDQKGFDRNLFAELLKQMKDQGIHFIVASGNQYERLRLDFVDHYQDLAFVAENGAYLINEGQDVLAQAFSADLVQRLVAFQKTIPDIHAVYCGVKHAYMDQNDSPDFLKSMGYYCPNHKLVDGFDQLPADQFIKISIDMPAEKTEEIANQYRDEFGDELHVTSSGFGNIDIMINGVNKAQGLTEMLAQWNLTGEDLVAFGDGGNDIEMLKFAKYGYAMENASPEVKEITTLRAPSNNDSGVLRVLEELLNA